MVPAAGVVGEAMLAFILAREFLNKFSGDHMEEIRENFEKYKNYVYERLGWKS